MTKDKEIWCYLFGTRAHVKDMVGFIKQYFPPDSIDSEGCEVFATGTRLQYQYYGTMRYNPIIKYVKKAYIRFIFSKEKDQWHLVAVDDKNHLPPGYFGEIIPPVSVKVYHLSASLHYLEREGVQIRWLACNF